jgi:hypothetical protein
MGGKILLLLLPTLLAHPAYVARNPNGAVFGAALGHQDPSHPGSRNVYGAAFAAQQYMYACAGDADSDGVSDGFELGDECCLWTSAPSCPPEVLTAVDISKPYDASSRTGRPPCNCSADAALRCACCSMSKCAPAGGGKSGGDDDDGDDDDDDSEHRLLLWGGAGAAAVAALCVAGCCVWRLRKAAAAAAQEEARAARRGHYEALLQVN